MNDVTKDLLIAIGDCLTFIEKRHPANWITQQARAAIARAETALAEPHPDADGWIPWAGGECPLGRTTLHQVRFRDGDKSGLDRFPHGWRWGHDGSDVDIVAYRIVTESGK